MVHRKAPRQEVYLVGVQMECLGGLDAETGDYAAGNLLLMGKGRMVLVGHVAEAMESGFFHEPLRKGLHLVAYLGNFAAKVDVDDDYGHIGDAEMAFGAFPQTELDGAVLTEIVDYRADIVPSEVYCIRVVAKVFCNVVAEVQEQICDTVHGC